MNRHQTLRNGSPRSAQAPLLLVVLFVLAAALLAPRALAQTAADSSVAVQWTAPGDDGAAGRASTYDVRYRTTAIAGTDTLTWWNGAALAIGEPVPGVSGATDSLRIRGLQPLTTYYLLIRTADEVPNWSGYSNVAVKTTSGDVTPPAAIANLAITGSTGTTLALGWTAPGDDGSTGTASSYDIRYSTTAITNGNWASATTVAGEPVPTAAGTPQTFIITGLSPSQTYYVAVRATDDRANVSALSNVPSGTTLDTVPPAAVRDLSHWLSPDRGDGTTSYVEAPVAERHESV